MTELHAIKIVRMLRSIIRDETICINTYDRTDTHLIIPEWGEENERWAVTIYDSTREDVEVVMIFDAL